ncbi:hypothetical protein A33M_3421 [Rhodovulum sp. PH10]|uniref:hypothetical protein n=1 Tax=Rhodovulum sp. PH10 TaxID=1187851 RepID=UPI00027C2B73|nr:hypothetical protein [Rhodovulum sp. PH10]EJW11160.1 hypothetical protein A33M_3421 [Rhodovulum sp. PH10]
MGQILDAFLAGRQQAAPTGAAAPAESGFDRGVRWAREVLLPAIERADAELVPSRIRFVVDTNLDPRSTNHAHVDFWLAPLEHDGTTPQGQRHSINVRDGEVWLYRQGADGENLGRVDAVDAARCEKMLARAAQDYGRQCLG